MKINNIDQVTEAFNQALELCKLHGLNWKDHVRPKFENRELVGYYILDETKSTTVETVLI